MQEVKTKAALQAERIQNLKSWGNFPQKNDNFVGRKDLLEKIETGLSQPKPLVIQSCHGLGGIGKTTLVTEYVHQKISVF